ncbi:MAG: DNA primase [Deltaproteobacteria bacterium]|nr:DNA primase [Deltaproteobacteria bacterium]
MSGSFDEAFLAEVRERNDIVSVIGDYVTLRKAGTSYKGLCPFHGEKTPSFHVHPDRQFFYCFGCQTGGDVLTFVREMNGYSFPEAVRHLAERAGMTVPERAFTPGAAGPGGAGGPGGPRTGTASRQARADLHAVNKAAWRFFVECLDAVEGTRCREYLADRGIDRATIERFGLGYAPDRWDGVVQRLGREGFDLRAAETLGLIVKRQGSSGREGHYDRFRHRLMFPIRNLAGDVIGFSGRIVPGDSQTERGGDAGNTVAKYVNSPESPIYQKGDNLYGLHEARAAMRKAGQAILVEGNVDLVRLSQVGHEEVVAPLGTALTQAQCRLLKRLVPRVVALYDGDGAGREAAKKAAALALAEGLPLAVASLPAGEDPDSFVKKQGRDALDALLAKAVPAWEHLVDKTIGETRALENVQGAKLAVEKLAPVLAAVEDQAARGLFERRLAEVLRLDPAEVGQIARAAARKAPREIVAPEPAPETEENTGSVDVTPTQSELRLLEILLVAPAIRPLYLGRDVGALVCHPEVRNVADALAEHEGDMASAMALLPPGRLRDQLLKLVAGTAEVEPSTWFEGLVKTMRREVIERKLEGLRREERRAYLSRDDATALQLTVERNKLQKQLETLKPQRG